jgi:hypothetical protein
VKASAHAPTPREEHTRAGDHGRTTAKRVQRNVIYLRSGTSSKTEWKTVTRERHAAEPAKVVVTTTVRVTGKVWAYRPRVKR